MSLKQFYQDPYLHIRSFSISAVVVGVLCVALYSIHSPDFYTLSFQWWHVAMLPVSLYIAGMSAVWMHNASHGSFKNPWLNALCGRLAGMHQLWGFSGWKIIHMIHHQYSDMGDADPHNPKGKSFMAFTKDMFVGSSRCITKRYRQHWGETARTRMLQNFVYISFLAMVVAHVTFFFLLLGPELFLVLYIPSLVANHFFYAHINYYAHPLNDEGDPRPGNMNSNLYYKICNALFFGIYYHGNHHRNPSYFNPKYVPEARKRVKAVDGAQEEVLAA